MPMAKKRKQAGMSNAPHRIRRLVFETGLHGRERAPRLQDRLSAFSRGRLDAVLAESLAPLAGNDDLGVFAKVELDLGKLSFSNLEEDLAAGIARTLKEWALRVASKHRHESRQRAFGSEELMPAVALLPGSKNGLSNSEDPLAHFLEWGVLPDSTLRASTHTAEFELVAALDAHADKVCAMVRRLGQKQPVRRRIAGQFSEDAVHRLVTALDPVNAPWIKLVIKLLCRLHAERRFIPLQNRAFAQLLWELALEYLSLHHWQALDAASLLRFLLQKLAARQKTSYEALVADVALRRGWKPERAQMKDTGPQSQVTSAILALLEKDVFGIRLIHAPRFVVRPEFQHLYSDFDVLAYWLHWRKLPAWSFAASADEMAQRIGPLLRELPAEARRLAGQPAAAAVQPQAQLKAQPRDASATSSAAVQIERWLLYGLWPAGVTLPQSTALANWLESQDLSGWRSALRRCSAHEEAVRRIVYHLSSAFLLKLVGLLAGPGAQPACSHIESLWALERQITSSSTSSWQPQASRYALLHVLRHFSSDTPGALSVEALAHATLQALSLRYQLSYERLLYLLRQQGHESRLLREIYLNLEAGLEHLGVEADLNSRAPFCAAQTDSIDLVLHYMEYGSLPETAAAMSFHGLQRLAQRLSDEQLAALARSLSSVAHDSATAHRMATLLPLQTLAEPAASAMPEGRLAKMLAKLQDKSDHAQSKQESGEGLSAFQGAMEPAHPQLLLRGAASANDERQHRPAIENHLRSRLDALVHLLRHGDIPWWVDDLVQQPPAVWFNSLLENKPQALLQALRSATTSVKAVDRLIQYVPQPSLRRFVEKAAPDFGRLLILYIETGMGLAESNALSAVQRTRTGGLHWRETLLYLLDENPSSRVPIHILRGLCSQVSQQLGLAMDDYLQRLLTYAQDHAPSQSGYAGLFDMLSQIQGQASSLPEEQQRATRQQQIIGAAKSGIEDRVEKPVQQEQFAPKTLVEPPSAPESNDQEKRKTSGTLTFPDEASPAGQLEYLLRYGALPQRPGASYLAQFMEGLALGLKSRPEEYRNCLQAAVAHDVERKHIARLFSPQALSHLWPILLPSAHAQAVLCLEELRAAAAECSTAGAGKGLGYLCIEELLRAAARLRGEEWNTAAYFRSATQRLVEDHSLRAAEIIEQLRGRLSRQPRNVQEELRPALDRLERETAVIPPGRQTREAPPEAAPRPAAVQKHSPPFPAEEPFYIGNAGAILLWPFLARYFQSLGLLEKNAFRGEAEKNRAVHLVQYLAAGTLEAPEHELLLNKVLCGLPPEHPLDPVGPVTDAEEALSEQLLHALITNWEKLRNTSVDGLRQSFLLREGRLLRKESDGSWSLTVSTKAYDMLLDSLPWRFSTVRLPWMQTVLHVKWR
jgi:hypothetical protein